jgi:hypothetical protein
MDGNGNAGDSDNTGSAATIYGNGDGRSNGGDHNGRQRQRR